MKADGKPRAFDSPAVRLLFSYFKIKAKIFHKDVNETVVLKLRLSVRGGGFLHVFVLQPFFEMR